MNTTNCYVKNQNYIKKVGISIDTLFRQNHINTSSSDFVYTLPNPVKNVLSMKVTAVEIPNFWYSFSSKNRSNEITITVYNFYQMNTDISNISFVSQAVNTILLPEGNYYNTDIINYMNSYFLNIQNGLQYIYFDIDTHKGKTIFRIRHPLDNQYLPSPYDSNTPYYSPTFYYTLDFRLQDNLERPLYLNMGWTLGFHKPTYIVSRANTYTNLFIYTNGSGITYNGYIQGESTFGNNIDNYLFLDIEDYNKSFSSDTILSCLENSYLEGNNILARLTINSSSNTIDFTTSADAILKKRQYFGPVSIDTIHVRLLNKYGRVVDLTGNDFSFFIEMEVLNR